MVLMAQLHKFFFIDDFTQDGNSTMNPAYRDLLSVQIQPNALKLNRHCFTVRMNDDPKHTEKATLAL